MNKRFLLLPFLLFGLQVLLFSQIKVACIGNSITYGAGIENRELNSYPAQLDKILGSAWHVENFGVSGSTLLKKGDKPYQSEDVYLKALKFLPDVVIIKLGTNDSKPQNWKYRKDFINDYTELILKLKALPSNPEIIICYPAPAYGLQWGINDSIIRTGVIPMIKKVSKSSHVELVDLYKPLNKKPLLFPDNIHPNKDGAFIIATVISRRLLKLQKRLVRRWK